MNVLIDWIAVSSYSIQALDQCMTKCRRFIRLNTIISLAFSTASGSLSVSNYSKNASLVLNILLTIFSFSIAVLGSIVKVYQYQERLEMYIKTKQDWINFASTIATDMTLNDNNYQILIRKHKDSYNKLLQIDYELFGEIKKKLKFTFNDNSIIIPKSKGLRIHDILKYIAEQEAEQEEVLSHPLPPV
jgi:hypothetical protein